MNNLDEKLNEMVETLMPFVKRFLIINVLAYLISSFIVMDPNPTNWLLFTTAFGRIIFIVIEVIIIGVVLDW